MEDYGSEHSYLTAEGIEQFRTWNRGYAEAEFTHAPGSDKFFTRSEVGKMSKSKFNVINPDEVVERYGADCFRMYEMFLGPIEQAKPWDTQGIDGVFKFLRRFWSIFFNEKGEFSLSDQQPGSEELKILHQTIKRVTEDLERFSLNTCVSHFMVFVNEIKKLGEAKRSIMEPVLQLLAPFAPHITEELWNLMGQDQSIHHSYYPKHKEEYLKEKNISYPVSVNGKKRAMAEFPHDASVDDIQKAALALDEIQKWIDGQNVRKVIVVPGRMINIVV